jgi:hypothetical protein
MSNFLILLASGLALIQGQDTGSFKCGCTGGVCKSGQSCSDGGKCVDLPSQMWLADGAPFCVRGGGGRCCGDNFGASCTSAQTCVRGTCVDNVASVCVTTPPPLPRDGKCFTCSTPGVTSFSDGCNTCSCSATGAVSCTEKFCITLAPEEGSCERRCDGSVVVDGCEQYLCINGQKTNPVVLANAQCTPTNDPCTSNDCGKDEKCVAEPKQCITTPCPQYRCEKPVVVVPLPRDGKCFTCATPGVTSFSDGCNTCGCAEKGVPAVCTLRACIALAPEEGSCERRCDGSVVVDGCKQYLCINGQKTNPVVLANAQCTPTNDPCASNDCGKDEKCVAEPKQCITTPCPQYRCEKPVVVAPLPRDGKCFTCSTPGVTSFSDGCNTCSCSTSGIAGCTKRACIALAPEEGSCERRCDGSVVVDGCKQYLCINGQKTNPVVLANAQCTPTNDPCASNDCGKDEKCVAEPKQCITTPCPQYRCEKPVVVAPLPRDGKCFTCATPGVKSFSDGCNTCGCAEKGVPAVCTLRACIALAPEEGSCERRCDGSVVVDGCKQYLCINGQKTNPVVLANAQCTPTNDPCASNDCGKDEKCVAEPKQCITTPCPQYRCEKPVVVAPLPRDGKCFTCSTPGVKSFSDGCNTCSCETGAAACTELACIALAPAEGSCQRRCDGAIVKSDCLECVCKNGQKTDCLTVKDCNDDTNGASSLAWASLTLAIAFVAIF